MNSAILTSLATDTPDGSQLSVTGARQVTPSDLPDPLALQTQTDILTINGRTHTTVYDASERRFTTTSPQNRSSTLETDDQGRPTRQTVTDLHPITTTYKSDGRVDTEKQGPDGTPSQQRVWSYAYEDNPSGDNTGFLDKVTDPLGRETSFEYDATGRIIAQTLPGSRVISYGYDDNGNLASITPPSRPAHTFGHSAVDLITGYTPPDLGFSPRETTYTYNDDQQLELIDRPDDKDVDFVYETTTRRLDFFDTPRGRTELSYSAETGNLSSLTAPSSQPGGEQLTFSYDGSLPKRETYSGTVSGSVSRTYDDDLRLDTSSVNDSHSVSYGYDNDSLLTEAGQLTLGRDAGNGLLRSTTLGQVTTSITPNGFGAVQSESASHGSTQLYSATLTPDGSGRIAQKTETTSQGTHTFTYTYDPQTGFLTDVHEGAQEIAHYDYDANGNRELKRRDGLEVTTDRDAQDRLTRQGTTSYTYSEAGDLETKTVGGNTTSYSYDALGSLEHVTLPGGTQLDYINDGFGRRIARKRDGSLEQGFLYGEEALGPVAELDSNGALRSRFVYATRANVPDYMTRGGNAYRILTDHLGSPRIIVDANSGQVAQEMDYDEYGTVVRDTAPGFQPFGFAGGLYDGETKLVRFGARDYDAEVGRWTAKDPILFAGGGTNLYGYALGDPVNLVDQHGLAPNWLPNPIENSIEYGEDKARGAYNAFTESAQSALGFWANMANDPCSSWLERLAANVAGPFAALGTRENLPSTALTVAGGGAVQAGAAAAAKAASNPGVQMTAAALVAAAKARIKHEAQRLGARHPKAAEWGKIAKEVWDIISRIGGGGT